jgi:FtsP/CotA-like multicopper oxidase with cupredoxin domain
MKTGTRWAVLGLVVAVAVVAFVIAQSGGGSSSSSKTTQAQAPAGGTAVKTTTTSAAPAPKLIVVKNEKAVGGVQDINVKKGDQVRFTVQSDSAQEIHVHGYDFHKNVPKNGSASFSFPAKIDGGFVIELEGPGQQIAALKVQP